MTATSCQLSNFNIFQGINSFWFIKTGCIIMSKSTIGAKTNTHNLLILPSKDKVIFASSNSSNIIKSSNLAWSSKIVWDFSTPSIGSLAPSVESSSSSECSFEHVCNHYSLYKYYADISIIRLNLLQIRTNRSSVNLNFYFLIII